MIKLEGDLRFNRELVASEVAKLEKLFDISTLQLDKPNKGLFPFKFAENYTTIVWDESQTACEIDGVIKLLIQQHLPEGIVLNGRFNYTDSEGDIIKIIVEDNKIIVLHLGEDIEVVTLLRCPGCLKVYKKETFQEVIG